MRPYLSTARRYRWLLAAILTLVWGAGIAAAFVEYTTTYESGATIWVLRAPAELIQRNPSDPTITSVQTVAVQQAELLNQLLLTKSFLRDVVQRTSVSGELAAATDEAKYLDQIRKRFRVEVLGTNLLMVSFAAHDPRTPPELVNAVLAVRDERVTQARVANTAVVGALYQKDFEIAQGQALEAQQRLEEFDATHRPPLNTVDEHVQAQLRLALDFAQVRVSDLLGRIDQARLAPELLDMSGMEFQVVDEPREQSRPSGGTRSAIVLASVALVAGAALAALLILLATHLSGMADVRLSPAGQIAAVPRAVGGEAAADRAG
ncbi:MAG: hypothetical protein AUI15_00385 [Actinobacteria bacterium 13_2_20CM_2_66_6]|nr:MAG: hypothetical protein AUI15_00385 [Actinobacteria bacterium 13_2_20CM_2_66_6]